MANKKYQAIEQYWHKSGPFGVVARATIRALQFIFAIVIAALYGVDLASASKAHRHGQTEWIYAELVVVLSAITCTVHCFVTVVHVAWVSWDAVLFVLWMAQMGVFGNIYIHQEIQQEYVEATQSIPRMKASVWIGLVNMLLWLLSTVLGISWCIRTRRTTRRTDKEDQEMKLALQKLGEEDIETGIIIPEKTNGDIKTQYDETSDLRDEENGDIKAQYEKTLDLRDEKKEPLRISESQDEKKSLSKDQE